MPLEDQFDIRFAATLSLREKQIQQNYRPIIGIHKWFALRPGAPFVFTYHHNDITAYAPIVVALLDARLACNAVRPAPAEMGASLHINNTNSSILDSVFVCRRQECPVAALPTYEDLMQSLIKECRPLAEAGVKLTIGDVRCLISGHVARLCVHRSSPEWDPDRCVAERLKLVQESLTLLSQRYCTENLAQAVISGSETQQWQQMRLLEDVGVPYAAMLSPALTGGALAFGESLCAAC